MSQHYSEDDLALYYYGEARKPRQIELHLESCGTCKATYREIAGTLAMVTRRRFLNVATVMASRSGSGFATGCRSRKNRVSRASRRSAR